MVLGGAGMWGWVGGISTLNFEVSKGGGTGECVMWVFFSLMVNLWAVPVKVMVMGVGAGQEVSIFLKDF